MTTIRLFTRMDIQRRSIKSPTVRVSPMDMPPNILVKVIKRKKLRQIRKIKLVIE